MKYEEYKVPDFLADQYFLKWVLDPDQETGHFWESWLENHPEKVTELEAARAIILGYRYKNKHRLDQRRYLEIYEKLVKQQQNIQYLKTRKRKVERNSWWAAAASLTFLVMAWLFYDFSQIANPVADEDIVYISRETPSGVKTTIRLPDGSTVKLNSNTILRFPRQFEAGLRKVYLSGEAFFEVVPDKNAPFIIESQNLETQVLGTSFNVRAFENESQVKVAVVSGLVKVQPEAIPAQFLEPEQMAVYDRENHLLNQREFDYKLEIGWKEGLLYFQDTPIREVYSSLENWYGITIEVQTDRLLEGTYSGEYLNESLDNVLAGIGYASGFSFSIEDKVVTLTPKLM